MRNVLWNVLAVLVGLAVGSLANMAIVLAGPLLIAPPAGVDVSNADSIAQTIHLFEPRHFITPLLAHAFGTLVGATVAFLIAASHRMHMAYVIGALFLCGGVAASVLIPAPIWFIATDLLLAYLPMAWLGAKIGARLQGSRS